MQTITCTAIRKLNPCYNPATKLPENYSGTVVDFLRQWQIPTYDRIWVAKNFVTDKTNRLFAVYCARRALALQDDVDPRSTAACDVAERFAHGAATAVELREAWSAARSVWQDPTTWSAATRSVAARSVCLQNAALASWSVWSASADSTQINYLIALLERGEP